MVAETTNKPTWLITFLFQIEFCMRKLLEYAPSCLGYKGLQAECMAMTGKYSDAQILAK